MWSGPDPARYFDERIAPILMKRCLGCHNHELNDGGIAFDIRESLLKGGRHGPVITPGKPEQSYLLEVIRHKGDIRMPPGLPLPRKEVELLRKWIANGAQWGHKLRYQ
jgi:hypothetical protein